MNVLDLFSGIGGFSLGLERAGMRTVAFCEIDPYCRAVLEKHWPGVPCHRDIRNFEPRFRTDVVCGGFPCQDISVAGRGAGLAGSRSGLWTEFARVIRLVAPSWVIVENVPGLLSRGLGDVLRELAEIGYDAEWHCIPAAAVGASHRRDRVWIVAYPHRQGSQERFMQSIFQSEAGRDDDGQDIALDPWWTSEPPVVRRGHGIPARVDRIRALGNAVVPQVVEVIGREIMRWQRDH